MDKGAYRQGQYAEVMTEYAEHIYRDSICKTERNYKFIAPEGTEREVDVCTTLKSGEKIAFEVRDRKSTQSIDWVDQIIGKYLTSPFEQVWLCTFDGCSLSSEAIKKLKLFLQRKLRNQLKFRLKNLQRWSLIMERRNLLP